MTDELGIERMKRDENTNSRNNLNEKTVQFNENSVLVVNNPSFSSEILRTAFGLKTLFDVTLLGGLDSVCVSAHRVVLAGACKYFATRFGTNTTDSNDQKIRIDDVTGKSLKLIVDFCYTGQIKITTENVEDLLATAALTHFVKIKYGCKQFLDNQLNQNPRKLYKIYMISKEYAFTDLTNKTLQMICENFEGVSKSVEFLKFDFESLKSIIGGVEPFDVNEQKIFEAAMKWIRRNEAERYHCVPEILKLIHLTQIDVKYLHDRVKPVCELHNCSNLLVTALTWQLLNATKSKDKDALLLRHLTARRTLSAKMFVIGGNNAMNAITTEQYCSRTKKWRLCKNHLKITNNMNANRLATIGDNLYFTVNPETGLIASKIIHCVDLVTLKGSTMASLSIGRHSHSFAVVENTLYVIGGRGAIDWLGSVERYDQKTNRCINCASMIQRRSSMSVAVLEHNGKSHVYVIGGELLGETLTSVELYCPKQNIWSCIPSMKFPRQNPGVGVLNQRIYVLGGDSDSNKSLNYVECYDPNTSVWTTIVARSAIAVATYENKLFAVGGLIGSEKSNIVERYNADDNRWTKTDSLNHSKAFSVMRVK